MKKRFSLAKLDRISDDASKNNIKSPRSPTKLNHFQNLSTQDLRINSYTLSPRNELIKIKHIKSLSNSHDGTRIYVAKIDKMTCCVKEMDLKSCSQQQILSFALGNFINSHLDFSYNTYN